MIEFKKVHIDDGIASQLIQLSKLWMEEDCCFGMRENTVEDLREPCYIALEREKIIGYAFGHFYESDKKVSSIPQGQPCFELDELYVLPEYRNQGIGGKLYSLIEQEAKQAARYITLATSNKNYKGILKFYAEGQGMTFHSAFFTKTIN